MTPRPLVVVAMGLLCAPLLVGCDITGRVDVLADRSAAVDVTVYPGDTDSTACMWLAAQYPRLTGTEVTDPADLAKKGCRLVGTLSVDELESWEGTIVWTGDRVVGQLPQAVLAGNLGYGPHWSKGGVPPSVDLTVAFPGAVLFADPSAQMAGNTVRWTNADAVYGQGWQVNAVAVPGPPPVTWPVLGAALGLLAGAGAVTMATRGSGRRAAESTPSPPGDESSSEPIDASTTGPPAGGERTEEPPEDPSVWASEPDR